MTKDFCDPSIRLGGGLVRIHDGYGKAFGGRKCSFQVYGSGGDYHALAVDDGGGFVVADSVQWREWARVSPIKRI